MNEDGYLTLPHIDERLLCKVKNVKKLRSNIGLAQSNERKLKNQLVCSSFTQPRCPGGSRCHLCKSGTGIKGSCTHKNVVYMLKCSLWAADGVNMDYIVSWVCCKCVNACCMSQNLVV